MKTNRKLSEIRLWNPCTEDPQSMDDEGANKFCHLCQKTVVDFTMWSDKEIIAYFEKDKGNTCGMFGGAQRDRLNEQLAKPTTHSSRRRKLVASLLGGTLALGSMARAQEPRQIHPVEVSQHTSPLPSLRADSDKVGNSSTEVSSQKSSFFVIAKKNANPTPHTTLLFRGKILTDSNEPQEGVSISISNADGVIQGCYSNSEGNFEVSLASENGGLENLTVHLSLMGFEGLDIPGEQIANHQIKAFISRKDNLICEKVAPNKKHYVGGFIGVKVPARQRLLPATNSNWHTLRQIFNP